ncbi:heptosyltransferase-3 [Bradyrhizobium sp. USDA 4472]
MKHQERGRTDLRKWDRYIGIPAVAALSIVKSKKKIPARVSNIGLIALGAIGDTILCVGPAVPVLRQAFPGASITLFTSRANSGIAPLLPSCDYLTILPISDPLRSVRLLRRQKQDILIDFTAWPRVGALLARLSGAKYTLGFETRGQHRHFAFDATVKHSDQIHEFENYVNLLGVLDVERPSWPRVKPSEAARSKLRREHSRRYIVCHPWASGFKKEMREWPIGHWRLLAEALVRLDYDVVFTGGPSDAEKSAILCTGINAPSGRIIDAAGRYSIDETAALLEMSSGVVSVNTGIMHLAAALDLPIVALHGPTNPVRWGPLSKSARSISPKGGKNAFLNLGFEYPEDFTSCMHMLSSEEVLGCLREQLDLRQTA